MYLFLFTVKGRVIQIDNQRKYFSAFQLELCKSIESINLDIATSNVYKILTFTDRILSDLTLKSVDPITCDTKFLHTIQLTCFKALKS